MITSGIDIGSLSTKAVILDQSNQILGHMVLPTGGNNRKTALKVFEEVLNQANLRGNDIGRIIATGYGRENIPFADRHITEITCHAVGIHSLFPGTNTIIDIGGQDTKGIQIDSDGRVENFVMNDKCAAGTGRFLEVLANALGVSLQDLGQLFQQSNTSINIPPHPQEVGALGAAIIAQRDRN
jgi:predicted CoA-substrate-specific enzyme activase